jgi:hypothetical protein
MPIKHVYAAHTAPPPADSVQRDRGSAWNRDWSGATKLTL